MKGMITCMILLFGFSWTSQALATSDIPADYRLRMDFLEDRLEDSYKHARYWQNGWAGFYAASTVSQLALWVDADDSDDDIYYSIGALKSAGGLIDILLRPHPGRHGAEPLRGLPQDTQIQKAQRFDRGEIMLKKSAQRAASRNTWQPHIKVFGVNLVAGGIIAAFGDSDDALVSTALGIAIGEANIWTQPTRPEDDWREYQQKFSQPGGLTWQVVPFGAGLAVTGRF